MSKTKSDTRTRVLIVDDHPAVREALAARIGRQDDLEVCGEAADLPEALKLVALTQPQIAIIDITLKNGSGIDLIKRIKDRSDAVKVIVWSMHPESLYAERALRAGALGYVNKDQATDAIIDAIRRVRSGRIWLSEAMADRLLQRSVGAHPSEPDHAPINDLTNRELEVFRLIGEGVRTADIAKQLHLSVKTIETYRERIRRKLGLADGTGLAHFAIQWVLASGSEGE